MEEIKVNDFVRTKKGRIGKVLLRVEANSGARFFGERLEDTIIELNTYDNLRTDTNSIRKHSENILDLIEIGDILEIEDYGDISYLGWDKDTTTLSYKDMIEDIKKGKVKLLGIVTKEQFNSIKYRLE